MTSKLTVNPSGTVARKVETAPGQRRSQRLYIQAPIVLEGQLPNKDKAPFSESTRTIVVNAHGALVETRTQLSPGQIISVKNSRTNEQAECAVKIVTPSERGIFHAALEFTKPNPGFWHISFPPDDWNIRNSDAKK